MKNDILWLADQIQKFADAGKWNDQHWHSIFDPAPPTSTVHRERVMLGRALLGPDRVGAWHHNPLLTECLQCIRLVDRDKACAALTEWGASPHEVRRFNRTGPSYELVEWIDAKIGTPQKGQTVLQAVIAKLNAIAKGADGPIAPDKFRYNGKLIKDITKQSWLILKTVWESPNRTASKGRLVAEVWKGGDPQSYTFRKAIERAQETLNHEPIGIYLTEKNGHFTLK